MTPQPTIPLRPLGRTDVQVTTLGFGAMELRGSAIDDAAAGRLLHAVLDEGINLIDTAIDYGPSEELIGRHLAGRRNEFFLASKCGCTLSGPATSTHDYRPVNVRAGVEQSLRRLRTDWLDLVQVHISPSRERLERDETLETLSVLRDEGKVRFVGMSGTLPHLPDHIAMGVFDAFQIPYSAVQREHEDLITQAAGAGGGVLVRGGAARGAPSEEKEWTVRTIGLEEGEPRRRWKASGIEGLLDGMSRHEFTLRFTLSHPGLSSTIVGTSNLDHLRSNVAISARGPLPADVYAEALRRFPGPATPAP